jgi:Mg2+ and Co2+ transporter CorA
VTDTGAAPFYEALVARFQRAIDEVERTRDVVVGSFELFTSRTGQQTNDLVKVLTLLTAIIGFCAAVAGLMGMNFKLAFFETGLTGFALVTGGLVVVALGSVAYARYRKWI